MSNIKIQSGDLVVSKKYGNGIVKRVLYDIDLPNPIGVLFAGDIKWIDSRGGGLATMPGDARFYHEIKLDI